jgi:ferredoxin
VRITTAAPLCIGTGNCVNVAPGYFTQDDGTGVVVLLAEEVTPGDEETVVGAARLCPVEAILVRDAQRRLVR